MKQLINFTPAFDPIAKTVDFAQYTDFKINKLYAIINITQNQPIYIPGAPGLGFTDFDGSKITLAYDTSVHSGVDKLNVFYEVDDHYIDALTEILSVQRKMLTELKAMNTILAEGLNISNDDLDSLRDED